MSRPLRITLRALGILAVALFGLLSMTGLYVVNPIPALPEGEVVWYYRRGLGLPMISSADGLNIKYSNGVTLANRYAMNARIATIIGPHVILKLRYSPSLYLRSTGNRDFSGLGAPAKGAEGPKPRPEAPKP